MYSRRRERRRYIDEEEEEDRRDNRRYYSEKNDKKRRKGDKYYKKKKRKRYDDDSDDEYYQKKYNPPKKRRKNKYEYLENDAERIILKLIKKKCKNDENLEKEIINFLISKFSSLDNGYKVSLNSIDDKKTKKYLKLIFKYCWKLEEIDENSFKKKNNSKNFKNWFLQVLRSNKFIEEKPEPIRRVREESPPLSLHHKKEEKFNGNRNKLSVKKKDENVVGPRYIRPQTQMNTLESTKELLRKGSNQTLSEEQKRMLLNKYNSEKRSKSLLEIYKEKREKENFVKRTTQKPIFDMLDVEQLKKKSKKEKYKITLNEKKELLKKGYLSFSRDDITSIYSNTMVERSKNHLNRNFSSKLE